MGTSALLAELYFTFFILGKGLAFEFAGCSSVLVSGCEHFAWWVRGMCKRAWYGEELNILYWMTCGGGVKNCIFDAG